MEKELLEDLEEFIKEKYICPESTIKLMAIPSKVGKVAKKKMTRKANNVRKINQLQKKSLKFILK